MVGADEWGSDLTIGGDDSQDVLELAELLKEELFIEELARDDPDESRLELWVL